MGVPVDNISFSAMMDTLNLSTLEDRRWCMDIAFFTKLVCGSLDCPELLEIVNFSVPSRTLRHHVLFRMAHHHSNYRANSPLNRMVAAINDSGVDIFSPDVYMYITEFNFCNACH